MYFICSCSDAPNGETEDKLSVILESTREYISSSSSSSTHTRNTVLGFTLTKEDLVPIKEQSINKGILIKYLRIFNLFLKIRYI